MQSRGEAPSHILPCADQCVRRNNASRLLVAICTKQTIVDFEHRPGVQSKGNHLLNTQTNLTDIVSGDDGTEASIDEGIAD